MENVGGGVGERLAGLSPGAAVQVSDVMGVGFTPVLDRKATLQSFLEVRKLSGGWMVAFFVLWLAICM